jgi:hypothetical protein
MPQPPGTGTLDQVLTLLRKLAMTPAYDAVLADTVATAAPGASVYTLHDRFNGMQPLATIDLAEEDQATGALMDTGWADQGFAQALVSESLRLAEPLPAVEFIGSPGTYMRGRDGEMESADYAVLNFPVDAVVFAHADQQLVAARKALLYVEAFRRLIRKDESLGGLVLQIRPRGTIEPGGGGRLSKSAALVMAARCRFDVRTMSVP